MDSTAISSSSSAPSTLNINKKKQQQGIHSPTEVQYVPRLYSICLVGNSQCILQSNNAFVKEITTPLDSEATAISCGNDWLMILTESGKVYSFGSNIYGQLALGHEESITSVKPIAFDFSQGHKITKISCGSEHGGFILDTGALYMFGCGSYGRLGTGSFENCSTPTQIVMHWSSLIAKPLKKVVSISNAATNILSTDNSFRGKQLHQIVTQAKEADDNVVEFTDISCGERHTIVLATRNSSSITSANSSTTSKPSAKTSIISFGDGMNGRLGLGSEQDQLVGAYISQYKTVNASSIPDIVSISA
jgi:alpha-tubulin suppressor-like RCC1 family protein